MNAHLTERQLIDYQFKLASDAATEQTRAHLETCEACRARLQALARKFASLDLLCDEITASEALVAQTVRHATARPARKIISLPPVAWLGATAAALVLGFALLFVSDYSQKHPTDRYATSAPAPQESAPALHAEAKTTGAAGRPVVGGAPDQTPKTPARPSPAQPRKTLAPKAHPEPGGSLEAKGLARSVPVRPYQETPDGVTTSALDDAAQATQLEAMEEQPPFAPASAIELVVLPRRESVQLTIYNGADLTLVRERRNLTLKRGWNWLQFMWANTLIDPTSLSLEPLEQKGQVEVQQLVFPPRLRELGRWLIHSEINGQVPFELTYFTSGLSWRAFYMGTLARDEKTMHLQGYVRVQNNSGEDYEDAQTRLLVGHVHLLDQIRDLAQRQYPYGSPVRVGEEADKRNVLRDQEFLHYEDRPGIVTLERNRAVAGLRPKEVRKEGLSEYFLYTIDGTETIPNEWGKRLLSFETNDIPVTSLYKYDEERWGERTRQFLSFANDEKHKLGQTPLPDGTFRIYGRTDAAGHLSYTGGADMKYIPVGEEVELELGPARLVEVKPVLMDYRTENYVFDPNGQITGWDTVKTWKIEIANARTLPVEIEITRGFATAYWTLKMQDGEAPYEKHDATHVRFKLTVEPRSKRTFEYTVTTRHGTREQAGAGGQNTTN
jgi:hypothetical protein